MYDTARQALVELTDSRVLERVALAVLRERGHPGLRITSPTGDLDRDAYQRPLFGEHDEIVLLASCENAWSDKLRRDLTPYLARDRQTPRPRKAIFVTTQPTNEITKEKRKAAARKVSAARYGVRLEILDLNELAEELRTDELHRVAQYELGVRPRTRRSLRSVPEFRGLSALPGATAPLMGRGAEVALLGELVVAPVPPPAAPGAPRQRAPVVLLHGPGGVGKSRVAVDVAAERVRTVIAPPSVSLTAEDLRDVPLNGRAVLIVDDAHRRSLAEVAALLSDPDYDQVAVVLTLRPGFTGLVGRALGLEPDQITPVPLPPLSDETIDAIVTSYGIELESFRLLVRDLVDGNPLLAHAACATAVKQGQYSSGDTADILRSFVDRRLFHLEVHPNQATADRRRAGAVAVAVFAGARGCDRDALTALRESINTLPSGDDDLEQVLLDLEEAELIEDKHREDSTLPPAYVVRPNLAGPVLVADALNGSQRVRLRMDRVVCALGRAAQFHPARPGADQRLGVLGLPVPPDQDDPQLGLGLDIATLADQFSVLAQAADLAADEPARALLVRALHELLAPEADVLVWSEVLTLAAQVAPSAPSMINWLRERLVAQWPPPPDLLTDVTGNPVHYRSRVEQLLKETADHAARLARVVEAPQLTEWLLDTAWLVAAASLERALELTEPGFSALTSTFHARVAEPEEALFARRRAVLDAVVAWTSLRVRYDPEALGEGERGRRPPGVAIRLGLCALKPLLSVLTQELAPTLEGRGYISMQNYVLPDASETGELLRAAVDAVVAALDRVLALPAETGVEQDAHALQAVVTIAKTPYTLLGQRSLGIHGVPLYEHARTLLADEAERLQHALVERWPRLPLTARYEAAERAAVVQGGGSLSGAAEHGDPIATRALADEQLRALLVVAPVDHFGLGAPEEDMQEAQAAAVELGASHTLAEATAVLQAIGQVSTPMLADFRVDYAGAAGAAAPDARPLLEHLARDRFPGDVWFLAGVAKTHPDPVHDWLLERVPTDPAIAELAIAVSDALPPDQETALLDTVVDAYVYGSPPVDEHREVDPVPHLVAVLAQHLAVRHGTFTQRLTRLRALAEHAPDATVDDVLRCIAIALLGARRDGAAPLADDPALAAGLAGALRRALTIADAESFPHSLYDDRSALGAVALVRDAPAPTAALLLERASIQPERPIPPPWRTLLEQASLDERRACAEALEAQLVATEELPTAAHAAARALIHILEGAS